MSMKNLENAINVLNPIITIIAGIIIAIVLSESVNENQQNMVLVGTIIIALFVAIIQVYQLSRKNWKLERALTEEEIKAGQRKLVRELFKEDFEDDNI